MYFSEFHTCWGSLAFTACPKNTAIRTLKCLKVSVGKQLGELAHSTEWGICAIFMKFSDLIFGMFKLFQTYFESASITRHKRSTGMIIYIKCHLSHQCFQSINHWNLPPFTSPPFICGKCDPPSLTANIHKQNSCCFRLWKWIWFSHFSSWCMP